MILLHIVLFIISFFRWHWKNTLKNLGIVLLLFHLLNIIHSYCHLNLQEAAEEQVGGNHLLHRHVLTGRISHTHLTLCRGQRAQFAVRGKNQIRQSCLRADLGPAASCQS